MKKLTYSVFMLFALSFVIAACSGDSYEKRLKKEKRAISNYIADNGIDVIYKYPGNHEFEKNEFYYDDSTGVYWRVNYPGGGGTPLAESDREEVEIRFDSVYYMVSDKTESGNNYPGLAAMTFIYGIPSTYIDNTGTSVNYAFMSPACVLPLKRGLTSGAVVDIIVPFVNGSSYQKSYYEPMMFKGMVYTYYTQEGTDTE